MITQFTILPSFLFCGLLANLRNVQPWLRWLQYLSIFRYCLEAYLRNEFEGNELASEGNPLDSLGLEIGLEGCIFIMLGISVVLRLLAGVLLKVLVRKAA